MSTRPLRIPVIYLFTLLLITGVLLAGCQPKIIEPQPPKISYGRDVCDQCGMIISEERFASALQLTDGTYLKFDDAGEMIKYYSNHAQVNILAWWVHDYAGHEWIRGEEAFFVKSSTLQTPMGTGIVTFQAQEAADKFAAEHNGTVFSLDEIRSQVKLSN